MTNLEILLAAENQITEINVSSDALAKLKYLTVFDASNNSIMSVPPELGNFTQLRLVFFAYTIFFLQFENFNYFIM